MKHFHSFRSELHQKVLSSLPGVSPAVSSAFSDTIHPRKSIKAFNQILVLNNDSKYFCRCLTIEKSARFLFVF